MGPKPLHRLRPETLLFLTKRFPIMMTHCSHNQAVSQNFASKTRSRKLGVAMSIQEIRRFPSVVEFRTERTTRHKGRVAVPSPEEMISAPSWATGRALSWRHPATHTVAGSGPNDRCGSKSHAPWMARNVCTMDGVRVQCLECCL